MIPPPSAAPAVLDAFRRWGYLQAQLDDLGRLPPLEHPELPTAGEGVATARQAYCRHLGVELAHIPDAERRRWLANRMEAPADAVDRAWLLERLLRAEVFEQQIQARYVGAKRFSLEGVSVLIPALDTILRTLAAGGAEMALLAMPHRGRLNVMANIVGTNIANLLAGFEDVDPRSVFGAGDVKYHLGATGTYQVPGGSPIALHLVSNPSHLEAVDPVALGRVRAKQARLGDREHRRVVPVVMHGDAAFAGQGVLAETLNYADIPGFRVGGTVHIVVNNLIGFTAEPLALHSSRFATDIAKRLPIPIFHVNGEHPEAVVRAAELAALYRSTFRSDVVLDIIGYRRHGHSEVDDPTITQPVLYRRIRERPVSHLLYAQSIGVDQATVDALTLRVKEEMAAAKRLAETIEKKPRIAQLPDYWSPFCGGPYQASYEVPTGLPAAEIGALAVALTTPPADLHVHDKVRKLLDQRREMGRGERPVDFGMGEALAFASLVKAGVPVRLVGQDSRRGTFNHRHAVLIDTEDGRAFTPLAHLAVDQARFEVYDSMLSEAAAVGYEYGYSRDAPETLVLWEAQFGDFANGAQIIIDQFLSAGEDKWSLYSGLVLLLPHGFEGQGPEHSSARVERYLQLCAEDNLQVAQPSTAAQYFHLLRRQALRRWRKPLVVFTPKSMLRSPLAASALQAFSREHFWTVRPDPDVAEGGGRLVFCTGKVVHELRQARTARQATTTAIVSLEQLYPFPEEAVLAELRRHASAREVVWVQEEPANMGAQSFVLPRLEKLAGGRRVRTVSRSESASPATGSAKAHQIEQEALLGLAFEGN
jgi:2-oxoglutarate dehydrogenase E1 component